MVYTTEELTDDERAILRPYFTNLDGPVFALVNLPEVVKGALFARYSRSPKSLRRLFLDEFVGELDVSGDATHRRNCRCCGEPRSSTTGCSSNTATTRSPNWVGSTWRASRRRTCSPRCSSGAGSCPTSSSRRVTSPTTSRLGGRYRYHRPSRRYLRSSLGTRYRRGHGPAVRGLRRRWLNADAGTSSAGSLAPRQSSDSDFVYRQAIRAKALRQPVRGILPAACGLERGHLRHRPGLRTPPSCGCVRIALPEARSLQPS